MERNEIDMDEILDWKGMSTREKLMSAETELRMLQMGALVEELKAVKNYTMRNAITLERTCALAYGVAMAGYAVHIFLGRLWEPIGDPLFAYVVTMVAAIIWGVGVIRADKRRKEYANSRFMVEKFKDDAWKRYNHKVKFIKKTMWN